MAERVNAYDPDTLAMGVLGKPHGVGGELVLRPFNATGDWEWLDSGTPGSLTLERDGRRVAMRLRSCRTMGAGDRLLVAFEGITTPEAAKGLTLSVVRIPRSALPPLAAGEYYVEDVAGCVVVNTSGRNLGTVGETFWNGAHDVMVVTGAEGEQLIPLVPDFVQTVDAPARLITVVWDATPPEGGQPEGGQPEGSQDG